MSLTRFANSELRAAGLFDDDADYDGAIGTTVSALIATYVAYGPSGGSAPLILDAFTRVANHRQLTPLSGEDDEWEDISATNGGNPLWRNLRNPKVFKTEGDTWLQLAGNSRMSLTFPCDP
jgi:hypothetical protein